MISLGPHVKDGVVLVAPMAGVTDQPFREACRHFGADWLLAEMLTSDQRLWHTNKSRTRLAFDGERPAWIQIAGFDPAMMADAARACVDQGADIVDINMGCPARKVCNRAAGSALLQDEPLVRRILAAVVAAVDVPVTLKTRLGWSKDRQNGLEIARIAAGEGVSMLTVHGRTRACRFKGDVDYAAIGSVKAAVDIPVIANGDITSPQQAARVLAHTGADGIMIGRGVQGQPWLPAQIERFLRDGVLLEPPAFDELQAVLLRQVAAMHALYGPVAGVRCARKHVGWTVTRYPGGDAFRRHFNTLEDCATQLAEIAAFEPVALAA